MAELRATEPVVPGTDATEWLALIHVEVESRDSATDIEARLPRYFRHLRDKYRMSVPPVVVDLKMVLGGSGVRRIVDSFFGFPVDTFQYFHLALPGLQAEEHVAGDNWLAVAWSALMRSPEDRPLALGIEAMRRIGEAPLSDRERERLGDCVEAYIDLPDEEIQRFRSILEANATGRVPPMNKTRAQIAEEQGIQQGIEKGIQQGIEKGKLLGLEQGIEKGIQQGIEKGKLLGLEQGELRALRAAVAEAFEARFGAVPADISGHLAGVTDVAILRGHRRAAVTATDAPAFRTALGL